MFSAFDPATLIALFQIVLIDLVLAGDNAVVIGLAAAGLSVEVRGRAIFFGIMAAMLLRIAFAIAAVRLLAITGLSLIGGMLLFWVCWKMWQELRERNDKKPLAPGGSPASRRSGIIDTPLPVKSCGSATLQIIVADVSMSLDNVLAVAGAAQQHIEALVFGLLLSVALMGLAASLIARILNRFHWLAYFGLLIIVLVAIRMTWQGSEEVLGSFFWAKAS